MKHIRQLAKAIEEDLLKKMVFIGGPRQVGKTTLAKSLTSDEAYLNWDFPDDRQQILNNELPTQYKCLVLDEIHKYKNWRSLVKGYHDKFHKKFRIVVTGSARLDHFRKGGDSLMGRYHYYRLHPFTVDELSFLSKKRTLKDLLNFGGFPEPLLAQDERELKRWHNERIYRVVNDDVRDLQNVKEISQIELLATIVPSRVGSPLSYRSIAEDLQVAPRTVESWIGILDNLYYTYRISPYGAPKIRAVKKENKLYLWDWSQVEDVGIRFENMVAGHLLKYCHYLEDYHGEKMELRFLRDTDKREVDFVVIKNKRPIFAVECKTGEKQLSPWINYFKMRTPIPKFYQVHLGNKDYGTAENGRVLPFEKFVMECLV
ncbi:MAG: AAA family ATPase [Bdellovibrionales bacterium GWA2_49_15]|nr:MAG: AAA family ATPase [Bdellovibrionales bacterium GWA2_49_15]